MIRKAFILLSVLFLVTILPSGTSGKEPVWRENRSILVSGGKKIVSAVFADLNDKTIRMESVLAKSRIAQADEMKDIVQQAGTADCQVLAAINGTFFNAYDSNDLQPSGSIETGGRFVHLGNTGSVIGFSADNTAVVDNLYVTVKGSINGSFDYPNNWWAWSINHRISGKGSDTLFTPAFGKTTGKHGNTSVVVQRGVVAKICRGEAPIPADGFTLVLASPDTAKRFRVGDRVGYKLEYNRLDFKSSSRKGPVLQWDNIRTTVGAGPALVKKGKIIADGRAEGFKEAKINTSRGQRSFVGVTKGNILIMGTVPNVTIRELAEIALKMGVVDGINLDGGASSGLYFKGSYITRPGRKLSNVLAVTKLRQKPVRVKLNGKDIFLNPDLYVSQTGNALMAPLEEVFKAFGGTLAVSSSHILAERYGKPYIFDVGSSRVKSGNEEFDLGCPPEIKNGTVFAPLKPLVELFGGNMQWDAGGRTASISITAATASDLYEKAAAAASAKDLAKAAELYLEALELDPENVGALVNLAKYYADRKEYDKAVLYFRHYIKIYPSDTDALSRLGWVYYAQKDFAGAEAIFRKLTVLVPDSAAYWIALGGIYADYGVKRYDEAESCYRKALTLKPTAKQLEQINSKLDYLSKVKG